MGRGVNSLAGCVGIEKVLQPGGLSNIENNKLHSMRITVRSPVLPCRRKVTFRNFKQGRLRLPDMTLHVFLRQCDEPSPSYSKRERTTQRRSKEKLFCFHGPYFPCSHGRDTRAKHMAWLSIRNSRQCLSGLIASGTRQASRAKVEKLISNKDS